MLKLLTFSKQIGMKYKFNIMTNYASELEIQIDKFNIENKSDLKLLQVINDEVNFVEMETSISNELLFKFGIQFGESNAKKNIEGQI